MHLYLYGTKIDSCKSFRVHGAFKFRNYRSDNNSIAQCGHDKVVALVANSDFKPRLIQYKKETNTIKIL